MHQGGKLISAGQLYLGLIGTRFFTTHIQQPKAAISLDILYGHIAEPTKDTNEAAVLTYSPPLVVEILGTGVIARPILYVDFDVAECTTNANALDVSEGELDSGRAAGLVTNTSLALGGVLEDLAQGLGRLPNSLRVLYYLLIIELCIFVSDIDSQGFTLGPAGVNLRDPLRTGRVRFAQAGGLQ